MLERKCSEIFPPPLLHLVQLVRQPVDPPLQLLDLPLQFGLGVGLLILILTVDVLAPVPPPPDLVLLLLPAEGDDERPDVPDELPAGAAVPRLDDAARVEHVAAGAGDAERPVPGTARGKLGGPDEARPVSRGRGEQQRPPAAGAVGLVEQLERRVGVESARIDVGGAVDDHLVGPGARRAGTVGGAGGHGGGRGGFATGHD